MKYSNCLIEALKAKLRNHRVQIRMYPRCLNKNHLHFYWIDDDTVFHFICKNKFETIMFKGEIKKYELRYFKGHLLYKMFDNCTVDEACELASKYKMPLTGDEIREYYQESNEQ